MTNILLHGLGQTEVSWNLCNNELVENSIVTETPNLYSMLETGKMTYQDLLQKFTEYCNEYTGNLNLCGLSLGGIIALDYAKKFPQKVNSLILIGTPYTIPKALFKFQSVIFHLMPQKNFDSFGIAKKDFISLVDSMSALQISEGLDLIQCRTLVLCGEKDKPNKKSVELLNEHITKSSQQIVSHSSHEVNVDNPQELAKLIKDFWNNKE